MITCAALIMASVFISFVLSSSVVVKMLAVGLSASVLVDATVVRLILVPATMTAARRGQLVAAGLARPPAARNRGGGLGARAPGGD